ncbi:MAG: hypothetical protein PHY47_21465 [Lachnospiraceae bacterium]|nr:hypothetical protein [Lachnospiraceae bacterium]
MTTEEKQKINVWIPGNLWKRIGSYGYESPTKATIAAFEALLLQEEKGSNQKELGSSQEEIRKYQEEIERYQEKVKALETRSDPVTFAQLQARYEGLQEIIREKDEIINILKRTNETLNNFTNYFKSMEVRQIPEYTAEKRNKNAARKEETGQQIEKICKNCNQPFYTGNIRQETCSSKCRSAYSRKMRLKASA